MLNMKKFVLLIMMSVVVLGISAQNERGRSSVGFNLGYGFDTENAIIGLDYRYSLTNAIRINPGVSHYIKKDGLSAWAIDLNFHYLVPLSERFSFYPIVGADLSFWDQKFIKEPRDASDTSTRFGANVGLGLEYYLANNLTIGLEAKYLIISKVDQAVISARIGYSF